MNPSTGDHARNPGTAAPYPAPHRHTARIRGAVEDDLAELARLERSVFAPADYPFFVLRQLFDLHAEHLLVLDTGSGLCGYVLLAARRQGDLGWILGLAVEERCRGQGQGRRLLAAALELAAAADVDEVRLTVEPDNSTAIRLYRSLGFAPVDARQDYFGPGADRLILAIPPATGSRGGTTPGPDSGRLRT